MYSTVHSIVHSSIQINRNRISKGYKYVTDFPVLLDQ
jgi:hypothetical protein